MTPETSKKLHALFNEIALEMGRKGVRACVWKDNYATAPVDMTPILVKELIWRPSMKAATRKNSTRELKDWEAEKLFKLISERLKDKFDVLVSWESAEELLAMAEAGEFDDGFPS